MNQIKRIVHMLSGALAAAIVGIAGAMTASATSIDDVQAALRDIGVPEYMVQQCMNQYYAAEHDDNGVWYDGTYYTYDVLVETVYIYEDSILETINGALTTAPSTGSSTTTTTTTTNAGIGTNMSGNNDSGSTTTTTVTKPQKSFINMTLEEKQAYVSQMSPEEYEAFINGLSTAERNSIIKQLSTSDKATIAQSLVELLQNLGMNATIDDVQNNEISLSIRDQNGNLVDSSSIGVIIDDTGWNLVLPFAIAVGAVLLGVGGLVAMSRKLSMREDQE